MKLIQCLKNCQKSEADAGIWRTSVGCRSVLKKRKPGRVPETAECALRIDGSGFCGKVMIDVVMPVDYLTEGFIRQLDILEPFGKGNEKPVFAQQNVSASQAQINWKKQKCSEDRL